MHRFTWNNDITGLYTVTILNKSHTVVTRTAELSKSGLWYEAPKIITFACLLCVSFYIFSDSMNTIIKYCKSDFMNIMLLYYTRGLTFDLWRLYLFRFFRVLLCLLIILFSLRYHWHISDHQIRYRSDHRNKYYNIHISDHWNIHRSDHRSRYRFDHRKIYRSNHEIHVDLTTEIDVDLTRKNT